MHKFDWILFSLFATSLQVSSVAAEEFNKDGLKLGTLAEDRPCRKFFIETIYGKYNDALCGYTDSEWAAMTVQQRQALQVERARNFVIRVKEDSSKPPVVPTKEQIKEDMAAQADRIATATTALVAAKPDPKELEELIAKLKASLDQLSAVKAVEAEVKP